MALPPKSPSNPKPSSQQWNTDVTQKMPTLARPAPPTAPLPKQPTRSRGKVIGLSILGGIIVIVLAAVGFGLWKFQTTTNRFVVEAPTRVAVAAPSQNNVEVPPAAQPNELVPPTPDIVKDPFNILLIGVDIREDASDARTDTIIVIHVDPMNKWASMTSIPRDTCATIPGYDEVGTCERINAAYQKGYLTAITNHYSNPSVGGMGVTRDAVEQLLGITIDHIVQVDFKGFKKIVDAVGGVSLDVPKPLWDASYPSDDNDNGLIRLYIPAGYQHMDGTTALRYARSRHQDADYGRSQRQQDVIRAVVQTLKAKGLLDQIDTLDQLTKELEGSFLTTLPINDITNLRALAGLGSDLAGGRIISVKWDTEAIIGYGDDKGYVPIWDPASIKATVRGLLAGPTPDTGGTSSTADPTSTVLTASSIEVMNGASIRGLAGDVEVHLNNLGFTTAGVSTAQTVYDTTKIIDFGDNKDVRNQLAQQLGISSKNIIVVSDRKPSPEDRTSAESDMLLLIGRDYQEAWRKP